LKVLAKSSSGLSVLAMSDLQAMLMWYFACV